MDTQSRFLSHLEERFSGFFGQEVRILGTSEVTGGDINMCRLLETTAGRFFIKANAGLFGLDLFEKEAQGLVILANAGVIRIPRPLFDGRFHQQVYLVMEWLERGPAGDSFWKDFGHGVARLHRHTDTSFGLDHDNFIGRLPQSNRRHADWAGFHADERILPLAAKALDKGLLSKEEAAMADRICGRLEGLIPAEAPSLLHGDLWNGNFMATADGRPALFDPAVYHGHREMDIAMTMLFGGFDDAFHRAYEEEFPLSGGWRERAGLFQLYPMLVHLLLFGGAYRGRVVDILRAWC